MKEIILRKAEIIDSEFIYFVKINALGEYIKLTWGWDEMLQRKMHEDEMITENISIIMIDGIDIGTLGTINKENEIFICRLYIIDKYQSKGIGTELIKMIVSKYQGYSIKLGVLKVNHRAKKLYEKLGFEVYDEANEHYKMKYINNTFQ